MELHIPRLSMAQKKTLKKHLFVYGMLLIAILHFSIFYLAVNIDSFFMAFKDQNADQWSIVNFQLFFNDILRGKDSEILGNVGNTLIYFVVNLAMIPLAFILSYFMYKKILFYKLFRFLYMVPMIVSAVVLVSIYKNMLSSSGPAAELYEWLTGKPAPFFIYDERYSTLTIVIYTVWTGLGMNIILFSGAMSRIPSTIIEYASLDGVKPLGEMFKIVLPIVAPTFTTLMLLSCVGVFNASGPILLFTDGMYGTSTIAYWMYDNVVQHNQYNYASALGLMLTVISLPIFFLVNYLNKKVPEVEF